MSISLDTSVILMFSDLCSCSCVTCRAVRCRTAMPFRLCGASPTQCEAATRSGARCSITSTSSPRDGSQRLVSEPLRCDGRTFLLHTVHFCTPSAPASDNAVVVFYLDFETSRSSKSASPKRIRRLSSQRRCCLHTCPTAPLYMASVRTSCK